MSVVLVIQYAMRMRHIVICVNPGSTVFSTLFHWLYDFQIKNIQGVFSFVAIKHNVVIRTVNKHNSMWYGITVN
jgi:hypothetical protein